MKKMMWGDDGAVNICEFPQIFFVISGDRGLARRSTVAGPPADCRAGTKYSICLGRPVQHISPFWMSEHWDKIRKKS